MKSLGRLLASVALAGSAVVPAAAQDAAPTVTLRTFDVLSVFRAPPWATNVDSTVESEHTRRAGPTANGTDVIIFEMIPKGEDFAAWTELYALMAETPLEGTTKDYRDGVLQVYTQHCNDPRMQPLLDRSDQQIFLLFCPSYKVDPQVGEIAVMNYHMHKQTLLKHYYHRRGLAFAMDDETGWPLTQAKIADLVEHLGAFEITPR